MVEEVYKNIWKMEIPLPKSPLKFLNAYVIVGDEKNLLIDTGFNRQECKAALSQGLEEIGISMDQTDIFITHLHSDHSGLVSDFIKKGRKVYCSKKDALDINLLRDFDSWKNNFIGAEKLGFPENLDEYFDRHPGFKFNNTHDVEFSYVEDEEIIQIGEYSLQCVSTPGHTQGIMCLYEKNHRLLFSGDHILERITPNISVWSMENNALEDYMNSLKKIKKLNIDKVFPSHRNLFSHCHKRIDELIDHHCERLVEVEEILSKKSLQSPYEVASQMKWDIKFTSWDDLPHVQRWFATGEAMAHLVYLYNLRKISLSENKYYEFSNL